jgi:hypothetical protein
MKLYKLLPGKKTTELKLQLAISNLIGLVEDCYQEDNPKALKMCAEGLHTIKKNINENLRTLADYHYALSND